MSDEITIEVDGLPLKAAKGEMLIAVTDRAGIYIPRFCYHEKLSIAANCRMCLVEVERAPKPLPACATPVADGMKVSTRSERATDAQRATMEFLLINHPLDCPICDQGGECELQDLAMGFGSGISRFAEKKRVVKDKNIGPLVSTDMTRCIHCTRCVRFGEEIAGIQELGTTGRGETMQIGTYVEHSVDHELSGNIIDLCPVGALNSKPYRYRARSWEMTQQATISPHDCVGSNVYAHVLRGKVMRVVPRPNEETNETWLSDRDRFSYEGIYHTDRLTEPMLKTNGEWRTVSWDAALAAVAKGLRGIVDESSEDEIGILASPQATVEEAYLLRKIADSLGTNNIDHRVRRRDFSDPAAVPAVPWLGLSLAEIEQQDALLVVGSDIRREVPLIAHRIRKASLNGAAVMYVNPSRYEYFHAVDAYVDTEGKNIVGALAAIASAAADHAGRRVPENIARLCEGVSPGDEERLIAERLADAGKGRILIGQLAQHDAAFCATSALVAALAELTGTDFGYVPDAGNAVGVALAGLLPGAGPGGKSQPQGGRDAQDMLTSPRRAYIVYGLEADADFSDSEAANAALERADLVACFASYLTDTERRYADVLLPIATFAETEGTFVNASGLWQGFRAVARPPGEARPGWKVLRVLGNAMDLEGFEYVSADEVRAELEILCSDGLPQNLVRTGRRIDVDSRDAAMSETRSWLYSSDAIVRRSLPLQETREGRAAA